jgi:mono/diheme cytochrome c family protein
VLGIAALLTGLEPARSELARLAGGENQVGPVDRRVDAESLSVRVLVSPAALGVNHFGVEIPGVDPATVERVQLTLTFLDGELGSQPLILDAVPGSNPPAWAADSPVLSQPGAWQAQLLIRRTGLDDARSALRFIVSGPGTAAVASAPAAGAYPLLPSPLTSLSYLLVVGGVVFGAVMLRRGRRRRHARRAWATLMAAGLVVACGGYVYAEQQLVGPPVDVSNIRNPTPPDERSLATGQAIYRGRCAVCHGDEGRGDGPASASLNPPPADLRVHMAAGHTDGQLFYWVSYGFPNTAMPAWQSTLSEDERWDVINFIRTFASSP